jgi:hypothetical protein
MANTRVRDLIGSIRSKENVQSWHQLIPTILGGAAVWSTRCRESLEFRNVVLAEFGPVVKAQGQTGLARRRMKLDEFETRDPSLSARCFAK